MKGIIAQMAEVIKLYKNLGETPLECILRFKADNPQYAETKMTYLGRLDPMAEGLLLVLASPAKLQRSGGGAKKDKYLSLDKQYEFEVLWGFETDTYDTLGLVSGGGDMPQKLEKKMESILKHIAARKSQSYPPFSSKSFRGNFLSVRDKTIDEIDTVERSIKIFDIVHVHTRLISGSDILNEIKRRVALVNGDFRQEEILKRWEVALRGKESDKFLISKFKADVSSGTYIRGLSHEMGKYLDTSALAWSIKRTRVGEFEI